MTSSLDQLRADFKLVWEYRRHAGHLSALEHEAQLRAARAEANARKGDPAWVESESMKYRALAAQIESDQARSRRIAEEVRTEKSKIHKPARSKL